MNEKQTANGQQTDGQISFEQTASECQASDQTFCERQNKQQTTTNECQMSAKRAQNELIMNGKWTANKRQINGN
jgi:hypothetical protein